VLWLYSSANGTVTVCCDCTVHRIVQWECAVTLLYSELYSGGVSPIYFTSKVAVMLCCDYSTANGRVTICCEFTVQRKLDWRSDVNVLHFEWYSDGLLWLYCTVNGRMTVRNDCTVHRIVQWRCAVTILQRMVQWKFAATVLYNEWYSDGVFCLYSTAICTVIFGCDGTAQRMLPWRCAVTLLYSEW
jgi:hypothetical protein